jgi:hypothetical protein
VALAMLGVLPVASLAQSAVDRLKDPSAKVRRKAADELRRSTNDADVAPLGEVILNDPDKDVRLEATWSLKERRSHAALPYFMQALLREPDERTRMEIAFCLGELKDATAVPVLVQGLEQLDHAARLTCAEALAKMPVEPQPARLTEMLDDPSPFLRSAALRALGTPGLARSIPYLARGLEDPVLGARIEAVGALLKVGLPEALELVVKELKSPWTAMRRAVVMYLGMLYSPGHLPILHGVLKGDSSAVVRAEVVVQLGRRAHSAPEALPLLIEAVGDRSELVREKAIEAVAMHGLPQAASAFEAGLKDAEASVRRKTVECLENVTGHSAFPAVVQPLRPLLEALRSDPDEHTQAVLERVLGALK